MKHTNEQINKANELKYDVKEWRQFNHCNDYLSNVIDNCILIKSYNTIVGMVDLIDGVMYEFGKYSRTTSKQFTQIHNQVFTHSKRVLLKETNWY